MSNVVPKYVPINWVNGSTPLSAQNLNHMEQGVKNNEDFVINAINFLSTIALVPSNNAINIFNKNNFEVNINNIYNAPDNGWILIRVKCNVPSIYLETKMSYGNFGYNIQGNILESYLYPIKKGELVAVKYNGEQSSIVELSINYIYAVKGV